MRNPFRKRNLMSSRDNPLMRAYYRDPDRLVDILNCANSVTRPDREDIKKWILSKYPVDASELSFRNTRIKVYLAIAGGSVALAGAAYFFADYFFGLGLPHTGKASVVAMVGGLTPSFSSHLMDIVDLRMQKRNSEYLRLMEDARYNDAKRKPYDPQLEFDFG